MTAQVSELMDQVLSVFGERDGSVRRSSIDVFFAEDVKFADAEGVWHGRDALDSKVAALLADTPAQFVFTPVGPVRTVDDLGFRSWTLGPEGGSPVVSGTDVITVRNGAITALYTVLTGPES